MVFSVLCVDFESVAALTISCVANKNVQINQNIIVNNKNNSCFQKGGLLYYQLFKIIKKTNFQFE